MATEENPFAYFDTGALSSIRTLPIKQHPFRFTYSSAHLSDLANSETPELELRFLKERNAYFIENFVEGVRAYQRDPFDAFENRDDLGGQHIAPLISFFGGGGPDQTAQDAAEWHYKKMLEDEPLTRYLIDPPDFQVELTNRQTGQALDQAKQKLKQYHSIEEYLKTLSQNVRSEMEAIFTANKPTFDEIKTAALVTGAMGWAPAKALMSRSAETSQKAASNDWIDGYHIAFGLHCKVFASSDKAALIRARLLRDYWKIPCSLLYYDKRSRLLGFPNH